MSGQGNAGSEEAVGDEDDGDKKMSLLGHLIELRTRLLYSFLAFFFSVSRKFLFCPRNI